MRRIDIDLLRAVAVLSVIFFHFELPGFDGGFLGVDIFFVISGYLITLHIQQQISESRFSFLQFYLKRIRRLFPALVAMLLLSSIAALIILPKSLLQDYSHSQIATSVYISNIYFWSIADYFDTKSILKPLLHTWTLSVEEQFYLVWPLFVVVILARKPKLAITIAAVFSIIAAEMIYDISPSSTFYLFPFRIFEFAIGALVCDLTINDRPNVIKNISLLAGGLGIILTLLLATENTRNPGVLTLPICIGTAVIIALNHTWINKRNIITVMLLRIGLVSYSAYLVHWPLVVFYKVYSPEPLSLVASSLLVIATYILAEIFYNFVERPTSKLDLQRNSALLILLLPFTVCMAVAFNAVSPSVYKHLNPQNFSVKYILDNIPDRRIVLETIKSEIEKKASEDTQPKTKKIVVIGDSHSVDVLLSLQYLLADTNISVELFHNICDPLTLNSIDISIKELYENAPQELTRNSEYCKPYHSNFLDGLIKLSPDIIIFSEAWRLPALNFLPQTVRDIQEVIDAKILILGRNPQFSPHPNILFKNIQSVDEINASAWGARYKIFDNHDRILAEAAKATGSYFISKNEIVCPDQECNLLIGADMGYADDQHWSLVGLTYYGNLLINHPTFKEVIK